MPGRTKVAAVQEAKHRPLLIVGDGVNDAPVLVAADVGVAMGAQGSTAASESADVVIMTDDISRVPRAVEIGQRTLRIALQSIWIGIALSVVLMGIAAFGYIPAIAGAATQELIDLITPAVRQHRTRRPKSCILSFAPVSNAGWVAPGPPMSVQSGRGRFLRTQVSGTLRFAREQQLLITRPSGTRGERDGPPTVTPAWVCARRLYAPGMRKYSGVARPSVIMNEPGSENSRLQTATQPVAELRNHAHTARNLGQSFKEPAVGAVLIRAERLTGKIGWRDRDSYSV